MSYRSIGKIAACFKSSQTGLDGELFHYYVVAIEKFSYRAGDLIG